MEVISPTLRLSCRGTYNSIISENICSLVWHLWCVKPIRPFRHCVSKHRKLDYSIFVLFICFRFLGGCGWGGGGGGGGRGVSNPFHKINNQSNVTKYNNEEKGGFPLKRVNNTESDSIPWRHQHFFSFCFSVRCKPKRNEVALVLGIIAFCLPLSRPSCWFGLLSNKKIKALVSHGHS